MRFTALFLLISISVFAQKKNESYRYRIKQTTSPIKIDGLNNEAAWKTIAVAKEFFMVTPMDTSFAKAKTEVRICFDENNIYVYAINYKPVKNSLVVESLRRDFNFGKNDNFIVFMDPYNDLTNGFAFGANAAGAQWDGQQSNGGMVDLSWDNKWTSATQNYANYWTWEAAIPFKSIRYTSTTEWGINFSRLDLTTNEKSVWAPIPRQFQSANLAFTGVLEWDTPPPSAGKNVSIIPYVLAGTTKNFEKNTDANTRTDVGLDAKIAVTNSLNLDLTVNPDFSQVEVDRQQTNLDRFELFFPERRQAFLENADIFAGYGFSTLRPFFSRRIGLGVPIQFGMRLTGKLDRNWRIGILDMQTGRKDNTPAHNFGVFSLQRRVFARSNIGLLFINKEATSFDEILNRGYNRYNRNIGAEFNLASANNQWTGKILALKSFSPDRKGNDFVQAGSLNFNNTKWSLSWQHEYVGENYNAEVGYVPNVTRKGYFKIAPTAGYLYYVNSSKIISHGPFLGTTLFWGKNGKINDNETFAAYQINFMSRATFTGFMGGNKLTLLAPFDPTNTGRDTLARGTSHSWLAFGSEFVSSPRKNFTFGFTTRYGGYYADGKRLGLTLDLGYRYQPFVATSFSINYNLIQLPKPWGNVELWLVGPRIDVTFRNNLFWTTFVQYNNQAKNVNLNTRIQWRYKPASDMYLVYTDNYLPENLGIKNRALVFKLTYWWNV